jgi:hypothetical protein
MSKLLRKVSFKTAIIMGNLFYFTTIMVHILIFTHIIPQNWISGGMVSSSEIQTQISIFNLVLSIVGLLFIQWANHSRESNTVRLVAMTLSVVWTVGLIMQLLGTPFEKLFMSLVLLSGLISHLRLSIDD